MANEIRGEVEAVMEILNSIIASIFFPAFYDNLSERQREAIDELYRLAGRRWEQDAGEAESFYDI